MLNLLLLNPPILQHDSTPAIKESEVCIVDNDSNVSDSESRVDDKFEASVMIANESDKMCMWKTATPDTMKSDLAKALRAHVQLPSNRPKIVELSDKESSDEELSESEELDDQESSHEEFSESEESENVDINPEPMQQSDTKPHKQVVKIDDKPPSAVTTKELVSLISTVEKSAKLYEAHMIYAIDTGGQAAFLDIAPAILRYHSVNIVALNLTETLNALANFYYSICGKRVGSGEKRRVSTLHLVKSFVHSKCELNLPPLERIEQIAIGDPAFAVIGTHYDKYLKLLKCKKLETLKEKNQCLYRELEKYLDVVHSYKAEENQLIFPVDTTSRGEDAKEIAKQIRMITTKSYIKGEIPVRWFLFQLEMKSKTSDRNIVSLDECYQIGKSVGMTHEDVKAALRYFHSLTVYLYFPSILPKVIFIHPQPLFDKLSKVIAVSFGGSEYDTLTITDLVKKGIFKRVLFEKISEIFVENLFNADDFLKLMEHLLIIMKLPNNEGYFIPCVLETIDEPFEDVPENEVEPLFLTWENAPIPHGLFPALIVYLLGCYSPPHFQLSTKDMHFRNKITLKCPKLGGTMKLIDRVECLGIYYYGEHKNCSIVRHVIFDGISSIVEKFDWKDALACPKEVFQCKIPDCPARSSVHVCQQNEDRECPACSPHHFCQLNEDRSQLTCLKSSKHISVDNSLHFEWFPAKGMCMYFMSL